MEQVDSSLGKKLELGFSQLRGMQVWRKVKLDANATPFYPASALEVKSEQHTSELWEKVKKTNEEERDGCHAQVLQHPTSLEL